MYIHCIPVWKDLKVFFDLLFFNIKISKNNKKELIFNKVYGIVVKSEKGCGQIMNQRLIRFTKLVLDLMFYGGFLVFLTLPLSLKFLGKHYSCIINDYFLFMLAIFGASGVFGILIIRQLRRMMTTVIQESCFVYENVKSLNTMAVLSTCIVVMFTIKICILPTPATLVIILVFFIAALFCQVLAHVFAEAVNYKEENDLTI